MESSYGTWKVLGISSKNKNLIRCQCKCGLRKNIKIHQLENIEILNNECKHSIPNRKDISNLIFGTWKVLNPTSKGYYLCECTCGCGTIKEIYGTTLRNKKSLSCGKDTTGFKDLTNKRFGEWKVLGYMGNHYWQCECQCKNRTIRTVHRYSLLAKKSQSCGCKTSELIIDKLIDNGYLNNRTEYQRNLVKSKDSLEDFIKTLEYKPTTSNLAELLGINRSWASNLIHKYKLEDYININSSTSIYEDTIYKLVKENYNSIIEKHNRTILNGLELDIYIPEKKIAIEFNGSYWHSEIYKDKYYHQQKTLACFKKGIQLIHIFEYEWLDKEKQQNIIKLLNINNKINVDNKDIYIKELSYTEYNQFKNNNQLIEYTKSQINLGCINRNNKIIGVMTLDKPRIDSEYQYEIHQLYWDLNYEVIDGTQKFLSYFLNNYKPTSIVVYVDINKYNGNNYKKSGFIEKLITEPEYVLVNQKENIVITSYEIDKHKYIKDEELFNNNYIKIYNSGRLKMEWLKDNAL